VLLACGYCLSAKHLRLLVCFSTVPTRDSTGQFEVYSSPHFLLSEVQIFSNHFRSLIAIWWIYAERRWIAWTRRSANEFARKARSDLPGQSGGFSRKR
jgi:hypothetical protein